VNEIELATLAGFFAGEGNITISGGEWPTLYAALGNTERFWVERFYKEFGGSLYLEQPKYSGAKFMFRWRVSGKKAVKFLRTIQPFLQGEKAEQLVVALKFQNLKEIERSITKSYPPETRLEMEKVRSEMGALRRAAAETNRENATPWRNDSPTLEAIPVS
jgi:hypothetical protein